ncbi:MAG: NAD(P)/FAD-dependent oxidoreductase [Leucobacter sp.]
MNTLQNVTVIGGGLAGAKTVEALREQGFHGEIVLIAAEKHLPYERPPLSKDYLAGKSAFEDAVVQSSSWYEEQGVTLRQGVRAVNLDAAARSVSLDDGSELSYGRLVLATGSQPRHLPIPGADASNVHMLRTVEDSDTIRNTFGEGKKLVLIGGGWIGLEVAATAREAGTDVTVLEGAPFPLLRVLGPKVAEVFAELHRSHDVDLRTEVHVTGIETAENKSDIATGVRLEDGEIIPADAIIVGVGVSPVVDLAEQAGLAIDNGVLVDAGLRTSDPDIFAVGDIANHEHPVLGHRVRVEHWANALNQPAAAVATLLGTETPYTELPYFFTDQYDLGSEYIGYTAEGLYDRVLVRGNLEAREFVAFWVSAEATDDLVRVQAAMNVNVWDVIDEIKPLIAEKVQVDAARLVDPDVPLSSFLHK